MFGSGKVWLNLIMKVSTFTTAQISTNMVDVSPGVLSYISPLAAAFKCLTDTLSYQHACVARRGDSALQFVLSFLCSDISHLDVTAKRLVHSDCIKIRRLSDLDAATP